MALIKTSAIVGATAQRLIFVDALTGDITEAADGSPLQAQSFKTENFTLTDTLLGKVVNAINTTAGVADAAKFVITGSDGLIDATFLAAEALLRTNGDAATLASAETYTDSRVAYANSGLFPRKSAKAATTGQTALSGTGALVADSRTMTAGERVLLWTQTDTTENGVYDVTMTGGNYSLARSSDMDGTAPHVVKPGVIVFVEEGGIYFNEQFVLTGNDANADGIITVGTEAMLWTPYYKISEFVPIGGLDSDTANGIQHLRLKLDGVAYGAGNSGLVVDPTNGLSFGHMLFATLNANSKRVVDVARLGVGTASPGSAIDLIGTEDVGQLRVRGFSTQNANLALFEAFDGLHAVGINQYGVSFTGNAQDFSIDNQGNASTIIKVPAGEGLRVDASANVIIGTKKLGVGTFSPSEAVHVVGNVRIDAAGELQLFNTAGTHGVHVKSPSALAADYTMTLPSAVGTAGMSLKAADGGGQLVYDFVTMQNAYDAGATIDILAAGAPVHLSRTSGLVLNTAELLSFNFILDASINDDGSNGLSSYINPATNGQMAIFGGTNGTGTGVYAESDGTGGQAFVAFVSGTGRHIVLENAANQQIGLSSAASGVTPYNMTLPLAQGGAGTFLSNNGSGGLAWTAPEAAGTYYTPSAVAEQAANVLVYLSADDTVATLSDLAQSYYAVGITGAYAVPGHAGQIQVMADDSKVSMDLSAVMKGASAVAVGDRLYWSGSAISGDMPTASGARVWQVGIVAKAGAAGKIHVQTNLIKVNA